MSNKETKIIWFTGLSGSGKSTISKLLEDYFNKAGKSFKVFDGDNVRDTFHKHLGFTKEDILENNRLIVELCKKHLGGTDFILVPVISPFRASRDYARGIFGEQFIEIFLDCPYNECRIRDVKGLYKVAESGNLKNFIGLHIPYEPPIKPEIALDTKALTPEQCEEAIIKFLNHNGRV